MNSLTAQIICAILTQEMQMPNGTVWLRDQNKVIPNDNGLYIVVGMVDAHPISNVTFMEEQTIDNVVTEHQINQVQQQEIIQIDVLSRSNNALTRNWEVVAAMQSFFSQQEQELNNFKIARITRGFINTSSAEGGSILNRYTLTVPCIVWYRKDTILNSPLGDYYNDFKQRVDDENTIGTNTPLIAFEIPIPTNSTVQGIYSFGNDVVQFNNVPIVIPKATFSSVN